MRRRVSKRLFRSRLSPTHATVTPSPSLGLSPDANPRQPERARSPIAHRGTMTGAPWTRVHGPVVVRNTALIAHRGQRGYWKVQNYDRMDAEGIGDGWPW